MRRTIWLTLLLAGCASNPATNWSCNKLKSDQATRAVCMETPGCTLTVEDMKKHTQTADAIKRYCDGS